ncbi:MAG: hypothetical protein HY305_02910 [Sphingobacteriales bacterium]|nr:hypothetical protein [Sphingobacteriales bacterium]
MRKTLLVFIFFLTVFISKGFAQDSLPHITVKNFSGKIIVSWKNKYTVNITNINIQRSYDSLKNFSTIGSVLNPMNADNGFVDAKPPYLRMYYRVFVSFEGGKYLFSPSLRAAKEIIVISDADTATDKPDFKRIDTIANTIKDKVDTGAKKTTPGTRNDAVKKDTLIVKKPAIKIEVPPGFVSSKNIYIGRDNNIILNFPLATTRKYTIKFFDENDNPVFELNKIHESYLILEKVNFKRGGWYKYHLYDNGILLDKYKIFILKDIKERGK